MLIDLTKENYYTEIKTGLKLVEFYATWCSHCEKQEYELLKLDKVWIGQVDVDKEEELVIRNAIHSFPTFLIYNDGKEIERFIGYHSKEEIINNLMKYLK